MKLRRLKKSTKQVIIAIVISFLVAAMAFCTVYFVFLNSVKAKYQREIDEYADLVSTNQQQVYVTKNDIEAGEEIKEENLMYLEIFTGLSLDNYISKEDFGKVAVVDIDANVPVFKNMISDDLIQGDLREEEFDTFYLSSNLLINDYIDLRIIYPNGEDYSVLSKKAIKGLALEEGKCFLWLNSEEILRISGAIVDCYLNEGSKLYTVKYVEPLVQEETQITYIPSIDVINLIKSDPNVVNIAAQSLREEIRANLDDRLRKFYSGDANIITWDDMQHSENQDVDLDQDQDAPETTDKEGYYVE